VNELGRAVLGLAPYLHGKSNTVRVPRALLRSLHGWMRHYPMPIELDLETVLLRLRVESLRGLCKTAVGYLHDAGRDAEADQVHALIGDMEPPV
jgi:hypothetical protein